MSANFDSFEKEIAKCLLPRDINYFILELRTLFSDEDLRLINQCENMSKTDTFLIKFKKLDGMDKFNLFMKSAKEHNTWIYQFMSIDLSNDDAVKNLRAKWFILENLLDMLYDSKKRLIVVDPVFIEIIANKNIITSANKDYLLQCFKKNGPETTLLELFNLLSGKNPDWYGVILYTISHYKTAFADIISRELDLEVDISESERERRIMEYSKKFIDKHITQFRAESQQGSGESSEIIELEVVDEDNSSGFEDASDDGATPLGIISNLEYDTILNIMNEEESIPTKLVMKSFQLELTELALEGKNVIIYAPTGIGKTIVAIYIANEHLRNNPNGKVAFLVPRRHLVTQQSNVFEKYKDPDYPVIGLHGKSEGGIGPLVSHLDQNKVFVMTGGIFYNALSFDDGNKLSSISEFSLIFFDECHNCMKKSPYTAIMSAYINEKHGHPERKMPQIVGLTASPRSNNSDDKVTMMKSILELCANLDCRHFAFVKKCVKGLADEIIKPKEDVIRVSKRQSNNFELSLIKLMVQCETKLEKMKKDGYFPSTAFKSIPREKFNQNYVVFVGNLQRLNNTTIEYDEGKQKVYAIYRYLNAYYRGLIVHQLFNEFYAKQCIDRYLFHDGETFTCCYDEEFNNSYKNSIIVQEQSDNPSIDKIRDLIEEQFRYKADSRILIFVQQVEYTDYLVDLLMKTGQIEAKAIVGRKNKNDLKGCSSAATDDILVQFRAGDFKVLVATSVVEEGLDVPDCNMVISYGYVTNETALIQRLGRARSADSKYVLILPPMFSWMEAKETNNRKRNETMMTLIHEYDQMDINSQNTLNYIERAQLRLFNLGKNEVPVSAINQQSWQFKCQSCQALLCNSEELRILETAHVVCINPDVLRSLIFVRKDPISCGLLGSFEVIGSVMCRCRNHRVGKYILYQKNPFLQLRIDRCTVTKNLRSVKFAKWKDFRRGYNIPSISSEELSNYVYEADDIVV